MDFPTNLILEEVNLVTKHIQKVPALNKETLDFENVNYFDHQDSDLYLFYFAFGLKGRNEKQKTISHFNQTLNEDDNLCPKCKEMSWSFRVIRYFD